MGKSNTNNKSDKTGSYTEFFYYFFRNILLASIPLVIISAIVLSSLRISATDSGSGTDSLTISISSACTLSSTVNTEHSDNVKAGTYKDDIGKTTIKTTCNDNNGYSIYANGYSNNEEGNNKLINTLSPSNVIETGLNTSGDISSWAMKLNNLPDDPSPTPPTIESDYNDVYGIVPPYWTKVAERASGTTDMAQGSSFTTTYAVYASSSQYAGTYQGQVKYLLTHPSTQVVAYYMQDVANWQNEIPNPGDTLLATDARDNKEYWVTRLADGHIWMTQNLDFDISANTTINSSTTDLNVLYDASTNSYREYQDGYTSNGNIIYWKPANSATTIGFQSNGPVTVWQSSPTEPYSASKTDSVETGHASLGNWYNWTAAIASNNSSSLVQDTINDIINNPQNSICPKGWRLPTVSNQPETETGSTNEFARLNYLYNNNKTNTDTGLINSPIYSRRGGNIVRNGEVVDINNLGLYYSSTVQTLENAYYLYHGSNNVIVQRNNVRGPGRSVRCVAR